MNDRERTNGPLWRRCLFPIAVVTAPLFALTACADGAESAVEEVEEISFEQVEEEPQGPADGGLSAVGEMCDYLVAPGAPAPPELLPEDVGGPETWGSFFVDLADYMIDVASNINEIDEQVGTDLTQAAVDSYIAAFTAFSTTVDDIQGLPARYPSPEEIERVWADSQSSFASMCPQWGSEPWPYASAPYEAVPPREWRTMDDREWALIYRDPDTSRGEMVVIYGVITQFDFITGLEEFRANVGPKRESRAFRYSDNTFLYGNAEDFAELVEDDIFRAEVTVVGSIQYDTAIGGTATAAVLAVDSIERIGRR